MEQETKKSVGQKPALSFQPTLVTHPLPTLVLHPRHPLCDHPTHLVARVVQVVTGRS